MSLCFTRREFVECPACASKPGSPALCRECLERREVMSALETIRKTCLLFPGLRSSVEICESCGGEPNPECKEHGR